jgi:hypothetical protein
MTADIGDLIPLAVIGFIGLVVGTLVGFLGTGLRRTPTTAKPKRNRDLVEVIRIWHDRRSGELTMEIGEKYFKNASELNDKSRRGFMALLGELQSWLGIPIDDKRLDVISLRSPQATVSQPTKVTPVRSDESLPPASSSPTVQLPVDVAMEKEAGVPTTEVIDKISVIPSTEVKVSDFESKPSKVEKTKEGTKESTQESKSIAAQVDEILQDKLANSSQKDRSVRLLELPSRGMVVVVNGNQYDGVGEVPDPEIRQLIQESVVEWERRLSVR